jgi:hypothetical protein
MSTTTDWPEEMTWTPTDEEMEAERVHWQRLDRAEDYAAWYEMQAQLVADEMAELEEVA